VVAVRRHLDDGMRGRAAHLGVRRSPWGDRVAAQRHQVLLEPWETEISSHLPPRVIVGDNASVREIGITREVTVGFSSY